MESKEIYVFFIKMQEKFHSMRRLAKAEFLEL